MEPYPFLANPPDLKTDVLYARDRGPLDIDVIEQHPDRKPYRLVREVQPGGNIEKIPVVVKPQTVLRAPDLTVHAAIVNTSGQRTVTAYARFGRTVQRRLLDSRATKDERFDVTWKVGPHGLDLRRPPGPPDPGGEAAQLQGPRPARGRGDVREDAGGQGPGLGRTPVLPPCPTRCGTGCRAADRRRGVDPVRPAHRRVDPDRDRSHAAGALQPLAAPIRRRADVGVMVRSPAGGRNA